MTCVPCAKAGDTLSVARTLREPYKGLALFLVEKYHEECPHPTSCTCLHRIIV